MDAKSPYRIVVRELKKSRPQLRLAANGIPHFKRRSAGPRDPASMKKKKFYLSIKRLLYLLINIQGKCVQNVMNY